MSKQKTKPSAAAVKGAIDAINIPDVPLPTDADAPKEAKEGPKSAPQAAQAPVPVPADPANGDALAGIKFEFLPESIDPFRLQFFDFREDGTELVCRYVRRWAKGEKPGLEHAAIEVTEYPSGRPLLLPGNMQLWETFGNLEEADPDVLDNSVFRITKTETVRKPDGTAKFVRFTIQRGIIG